MTPTASEALLYRTDGGLEISRTTERVSAAPALAQLGAALDRRRGLLLASSYEYPGRYRHYDIGFVDPPLSLEARGRTFSLLAHNRRGELLLQACKPALRASSALRLELESPSQLRGVVPAGAPGFAEEERTGTPSLFTVVRTLRALFGSQDDAYLGLYGAFGYDLVFQFEALRERQARVLAGRDLVLYLPDELLVWDHASTFAQRHRYEFGFAGERSLGLSRDTADAAFVPTGAVPHECDHTEGEFEAEVERARQAFARGDLFEVTPSQLFRRRCPAPPSRVFAALREANPAPYGFLANLGDNEFLVGASPEMYVRVQGRRVETCPIAGTIARGSDAFADARQILTLLGSDKDAAELTMCTDVDRNDKARICEPGSVRVIGRRQIELYSRLIHTVDHVEGQLRDGYDGIDAFLSHLWAVTVTGAPKLDAMQFIEDHERSPRGYYAGAVGALGFDGTVNTGLALRTLRIRAGIAELRVGATLHWDSDPAEEQRECELKASALFGVLDRLERPQPKAATPVDSATGTRLRVLLIDHRDSFVHTLGDYFRQAGAEVVTLRHGFDFTEYDRLAPELVVLSPGPARPDDFEMRVTLGELARRGLPVFGVCLGLQGIVEYCGGRLGQLAIPVHGKPSRIRTRPSALFEGLPESLMVGRYHSLYAEPSAWPEALECLAETDDGVVMALAHRQLPWSAVQFHPESLLSAEGGFGLRLIRNVVSAVRAGSGRADCA